MPLVAEHGNVHVDLRLIQPHAVVLVMRKKSNNVDLPNVRKGNQRNAGPVGASGESVAGVVPVIGSVHVIVRVAYPVVRSAPATMSSRRTALHKSVVLATGTYGASAV